MRTLLVLSPRPASWDYGSVRFVRVVEFVGWVVLGALLPGGGRSVRSLIVGAGIAGITTLRPIAESGIAAAGVRRDAVAVNIIVNMGGVTAANLPTRSRNWRRSAAAFGPETGVSFFARITSGRKHKYGT